jgi:hypothetical protein
MASSRVERKSATDSLMETIDEAVESAANKLSRRQFDKVEKKFNDLVDRAVASRSRRRETA